LLSIKEELMAKAKKPVAKKSKAVMAAAKKPVAKTKSKAVMSATKKPMAKASKKSKAMVGDRYSCEECGLSIVIEEPCECGIVDLTCCGVPMMEVCL
jgi:hypothetical protein